MKKLVYILSMFCLVFSMFGNLVSAAEVNVAINKSVTGGSSESSSSSYAIVTDGLKTGKKYLVGADTISAGSVDSKFYITVDLGEVYSISDIKGLLVSDVFYQWNTSADVFISTDNIVFTKYGTIKHNNAPSGTVSSSKLNEDTAAARYIKVSNFLINSSYSRAAINELEVYGSVEPVPSTITDLVAKASNTAINLTWLSVENATSYTVMRATTSGGPYSIIQSNVINSTYLDEDVNINTTYYYVVTATNAGGESAYSNEASATLQEDRDLRAVLSINLTNGTEKEFDLSMTEINDFINWYDQKDAGVGSAKYAFIKNWNKGPFTKRTEYIVFDKILSFSIDEYATEE